MTEIVQKEDGKWYVGTLSFDSEEAANLFAKSRQSSTVQRPKMKKSDTIILYVLGIGALVELAIWMFYPEATWPIYIGVAIGTLIVGPKIVKDAAEQKLSRKILDE